jgi:protein SCO1/2
VVCLVAACLLHAQPGATASPALPRLDRVMFAEPPKPVDDFELTDHHGEPFRFSTLRGAPALVFFGFAHCPDVCPAALAKLKLLRAGDEALARARVVFISVDGERDTPEALKAWLAGLSPDFLGLTGDPEAVREVAARFAAAFFKDQPTGAAGDYQVQHSSQIFLVDAAGRLRAEFYDASVDTMATLTHALLREEP